MTTLNQTARADLARAAAQATLTTLPIGAPLRLGQVTAERPASTPAGQAVCARFSGAVTGEVAVVVGQDLVDALRQSPLGELDPAQALQGALEAAAKTLGPVVVDPGQTADPEVGLGALAARGEALYVPLLEGEEVRALLALVVTPWPAPAGAQAPADPGGAAARFDLLHEVEMEVTAELGRTRMTVRELLSLAPGAVVELDRAAGSPADLLVNGRLIARGEVVVIDENFGIRVTEIVSPQ
ncbi:flagellar motor switch protein FliN [Actinomadura hibisca]|uniref:flagellar motor switch protein FliN n=1 Tax=Actinomadura hibisca TaxID=68565 RepID=UPI00082D2D05|nr:flagellar motor switch protein FliN [Actinomadura hibisca]